MTDYISRADAIVAVSEAVAYGEGFIDVLKAIEKLPSAEAVDCTDFIEWLVDRVLDETIWEDNSVAYGEIICRKLEKLGVLEVTEEPSYYIRPSADAVQGEWIRKEREYNDCDGYYAHYWYECSVCGARPPKGQWKNEWHSDYCPSCGARMKGGAE